MVHLHNIFNQIKLIPLLGGPLEKRLYVYQMVATNVRRNPVFELWMLHWFTING